MAESNKATVTIQIGNSDDKLTQKQWAAYVEDVSTAVKETCPDVHFFGGSPNWTEWQNVAMVVNASKEDLTCLRLKLADIKKLYNQDSIAWTQGVTAFV